MAGISTNQLIPLRVPAAVLLAVLVASWLIVASSERRLDNAEARLRAQKVALDEVRNRYQRSDDEKATILRYLPEYQQLVDEGFIGPERRITWIEALREADAEAGLYGVEYQIDAQAPYSGSEPSAPIEQRLRQSTMRLTFGVTHEGDLLRFLRGIERRRAGIIAVDSCSLQPVAGIASPAPRRANLTARCEIRWITAAPTAEAGT
jgi:type II secretory pathway pseudopilin PulG